jgi:hypothetical protein
VSKMTSLRSPFLVTAVFIFMFCGKGWSQDPCSVVVNSVAPAVVQPYSEAVLNTSSGFILTVTGSGFLWANGSYTCLASANSSHLNPAHSDQ